MDLQERKIHFVQEFLSLESEAIIHKLEKTLKTEKARNDYDPTRRFTVEELNEKIDRAEDDIKNGRFRTIEQLREDIKAW